MVLNIPAQARETTIAQRGAGLGFWMERVLEECDRARENFAADPVHDLRVALRRCRSMADGLMAIDPGKSWKAMKKAAKPLFQALGDLRDMQVMEEVVQSLGTAEDPVVKCVLEYAKSREHELKGKSLAALEQFDHKSWNTWSKELPRRASHVPPGSIVFRHMALERWTEARQLQRQALRSQSQLALHRLRIGLKRLRYTVENFLPEMHEKWIEDLKRLQDQLGEVHDLDVLWAKMVELKAFPDEESQHKWHGIVTESRNARIDKYRDKMGGRQSLWSAWRAELPRGGEVRKGGLERLRLWASFLDPDVRHSRHVTQLALKLYDGLLATKVLSPPTHEHARDVLQAAAIVHEVGRSKVKKSHHKRSSRLIAKLTPPLGWSADELRLVATVARYHRGALPQVRHKQFATLNAEQRKTVVHLAAVLRLAEAFDCDRSGAVAQVEVQAENGYLVVYAKGFLGRGEIAEHVAAARYPIETIYNRPVWVRARK